MPQIDKGVFFVGSFLAFDCPSHFKEKSTTVYMCYNENWMLFFHVIPLCFCVPKAQRIPRHITHAITFVYFFSFQKMKQFITHPQMLKFMGGANTDTHIYIATEEVLPLGSYIDNVTPKAREFGEVFFVVGLQQLSVTFFKNFKLK